MICIYVYAYICTCVYIYMYLFMYDTHTLHGPDPWGPGVVLLERGWGAGGAALGQSPSLAHPDPCTLDVSCMNTYIYIYMCVYIYIHISAYIYTYYRTLSKIILYCHILSFIILYCWVYRISTHIILYPTIYELWPSAEPGLAGSLVQDRPALCRTSLNSTKHTYT